MNQLQYESSPYLRQHADNPVDWLPWSEEMLARARRENRPIVLSIGYSTCHWCHVMERESFRDEDVAAFMNEHFINVKVDREERPDLDQLYLEAVQLLSRSSGWPLNVFLTPEGKPFYGGTYFPPEPSGRQLSWFQALQYALYNFRENRQAVERQGDRILQTIAQGIQGSNDPRIPVSLDPILSRFDEVHGGFGDAPKFPDFLPLYFLLVADRLLQAPSALGHFEFTIGRMTGGGIYDQLGGGLCRYAVDDAWQIPHFEKMLYDNALLIWTLAAGHRRNPSTRYVQLLQQTFDFLQRELKGAEGGYCAGLDADSGGREGGYYLWSWQEAEQLLGEQSAPVLDYFGLQPEGNWEGANVLHRARTDEEIGKRFDLSADRWASIREEARDVLLAFRQKRPAPRRDDKVLLSWNALLVSALANAFQATGEERYRREAGELYEFLLDRFWHGQAFPLRHSYLEGKARFRAFLDDYALLIRASLDLYAINFDLDLLQRAGQLTDYALEHFSAEETGLFYYTDDRQSDLPLRRVEIRDLELPSGNSVMADNLQRLGLLLDRSDYRRRATQMLQSVQPAMQKEPLAHTGWLAVEANEKAGWNEVAIVGPDALEMARELNRHFLPNLVLMAAPGEHPDYPLLQNRPAQERTLLYLCRDYACQRPVETVKELLENLRVQGSKDPWTLPG